jgi:thiaminase/transcriptional activator TenA
MAFGEDLLDHGTDLWQAQYEHPFVVELAAGTLDEAAFLTWVRQDYR